MYLYVTYRNDMIFFLTKSINRNNTIGNVIRIILNTRELALLVLSYRSEFIRDVCLREQIAVETYGEEVAMDLISRIADMNAAESPLELPVGNPHPLDPPKSHIYSISLVNNHRLLFASNHAKHRGSNGEEIVWGDVFRVQVIDITAN